MAFKLDFAKMTENLRERRAMAPEDLKALEDREYFESNVPHVLKDEAHRASMEKEVRFAHLVEHPYSRHLQSGGRSTTFYHAPEGSQPDFETGAGILRAYHHSSEAENLTSRSSHDAQPEEALLGRLDKGSVVTLLGEERSVRRKDPRTDRWASVKEFHVVRFAEGKLTMEQMVSHRHGGEADKLVAAAHAHAASDTDAKREAIARAYLGQEPAPRMVSPSKGPDGADVDGSLKAFVGSAKANDGR